MEIIQEFAEILAEPKIALFAAIWGLGYLLKNHTKVSTDIIPFVLVGFGIALGLVLVELSIAAAVFGAVIAVWMIGGHSFIKNAILKQ